MAEATPPRKTTTYNRFSTMASQNERYNTKEDEFFWLENIMRTAPHKLHSVPGPRTVASFPIAQPCLPDAPRDHQSIAQVGCTLLQTGFPPGTLSGNTRASWGFIDNGSVIVAVVEASGSTYQVIQADVSTGTVIGTLTPIPTPFFGTILLVGQSDEQSYAFFGGVGGGDQNMWYFSWPNQKVTKFVKNYPGFLITAGPLWAKHGEFFYSVIQWGFGSSPASFISVQQFSFTGAPNGDGTFQGTFIQDNITTLTQPTSGDPPVTPLSVQATDNFVYVLVLKSTSGTNPGQLYKFNTSDLTLADMFQFDYLTAANPVNNAAPSLIYVVSDDLTYITRTSNLSFAGGGPAEDYALEFGYVDWLTHSYEYIDRVFTSTLNCASVGLRSANLVFQNGNFYYGSSASDLFGGPINIAKIGPVNCPNLFHGGLTVTLAELELPSRALTGQISYAAFSITIPETAGQVSQAYLQVPASGEGAELVIVKSADENRSSTTTLTADNELIFPIGASETWMAIFEIVLKGGSATNLNFTFTAPSGATGQWSDINQDFQVNALGATEILFAGSNDVQVTCVVAVTNSTTPGNVSFVWAPTTSNPSNTTVKAFSSFIAGKQ